MAWASCPTHGPIQDAKTVLRGKERSATLWCTCGLQAQPYKPEGFRAPEDLGGVQVGDNLNEAPQDALPSGQEEDATEEE